MTEEAAKAMAARDNGPQLIVALVIIGAVTAIGLGVLVVIHLDKDEMVNGAALTLLGTIVGGLIQSLNSPTGIGSVIKAAMQPQPPVGQ